MKSSVDDAKDFRGIRCVFLDRDGVINRKAPEGKYISEWSDFAILPGVEASIARLNRSGYMVLVVSNQRGIALRRYAAKNVDSLHEQLQERLASAGGHIDAFYYCPHDKGQCICRKPDVGLFERAVRDFPSISPAESIVIGDSLSDIQAAQNFGCRSIFVEGDPETRKPGNEKALAMANATVGSLAEAVSLLLAK